MNKKITDVKSNEENEVQFTYDTKNYIVIPSERVKLVNKQLKKTVYCMHSPSEVALVKFGMPIQEVEGYEALYSELVNVIPA
ncbi:MAG: hypothetical protein PF439_09620 [Helicobacteraceae bacterium]|jgi:hypothetical protein|nr:hypothetical protein [Helicobacteraceae bacterium]